jgi:glucose/arabinose dehydrogenase
VLWAGGAGQDGLPTGHPYEYFDAVGLHTGVPDYGWPDCEENQVAYVTGSNCSGTVIPLIETPAYQTIIGAVFYPTFTGKAPVYDFGATYHGSVFLTGHGSWHATNGIPDTPPRVMFVPMTGDAPTTVVDFNDVTTQWTEFLYGFQNMGTGVRVGKPTGIAVGPQGTLFIADDDNNDIYQIRPHLN